MPTKDPIYLLDGYALIYRSYFGFIRSPLKSPSGRNISAVFGFFKGLLSIIEKRESLRVAVLMDSIGKTFRHELYPAYKATRDKSPDELFEQIPLIEELLELLGVPTLRVDGFEADDLMGTLALRAKKEGRPAYIVSGDKDLLQFCSEKVGIIKMDKGNLLEINRQGVFDEWGVWPEQIVDYLSLVGDSSDNVPGVGGIGAKTAAALLQSYETLEGIYNNLENIKGKSQREKLMKDRENAFFSKELVTIRTDVPLSQSLEELLIAHPHSPEAAKRFLEEGMPSLSEIVCPDLEPRGGEAQSSQKQGEYQGVLTERDLQDWMEAIRAKGMVALDCETDSLDAMRARLVGICLSVGEEKGCYIPLKAPDSPCLGEDLVRRELKALLEGSAVKVIGQNFKYDYKVLKRWGVEVPGLFFDTMVAAWVLDAGSPVGMDFLAERYLGYRTLHYKDVVPKGKLFEDVPLEKAIAYAAEDADITWRLYEVLSAKLGGSKALEKLFYDLEMPLVTILARMEEEGIILCPQELRVYGRELELSLEALRKEIFELCGKEFNINSTKQLQQVLFEERKLQPIKRTKAGYSTDTSVLQRLAMEDPVPEKILLHRGLGKLKSTYVDTLPGEINPYSGRIHTTFLQTGAATGRMACKNPNLQNIPVRDENGRRIRRAFRAADGKVFLSADYSQIELVVLAHLSGDKGLKEAFLSGEDVHRKTAATIFKVPTDQVSPEQRRVAKTINFGVMYGMSSFRLSNELNIPRSEAQSFIDTYFEEYAGIREFVDATVSQAEKDGGVYTLLKRFRPIPEINSKNKMEKGGAIRVAVNTRIQGSAADIVKRAMLGIDWGLQEKGLQAKMILQVHDEIILEVPQEEVESCASLLRKVMEKAWIMDLPLMVNIESGVNWGDLH